MEEHVIVGVIGCISIFFVTGSIIWCVGKFV